ncbi:hypothetical protein ACFPVX_16970 [Cohnella faecalis]|uniref:Uncharacterized protein n=1 Tax=Cohnella faecalis TaxID=2315694 RepID=A0A398CSQ1_9BACL|nr:hypothetical protein [Cohnella faecalis]RIE02837.1 hypothetical protein D3H35_19600 [Cohnella faecalis]
MSPLRKGAALACLVLLAVQLQGCGARALSEPAFGPSAEPAAASKTPSAVKPAPLTAEPQVKRVSMSPPIPMQLVNLPLFGDRDGERIDKLLNWVAEADRHKIDGVGLSSPLHGRSWAVDLEYEDGATLQIRPAWQCESTQDEQGDTTSNCQAVAGKVWIAGSDREAYFADSAPLFRFVTETFQEWMPGVKPVEYPELIRPGQPFAIKGHGSLASEAHVVLSKDNKPLWTSESVAVMDGEFEINGMLPENSVPEGAYQLDVKSDKTSYGFTVNVSSGS